jgi:hypothetical protein
MSSQSRKADRIRSRQLLCSAFSPYYVYLYSDNEAASMSDESLDLTERYLRNPKRSISQIFHLCADALQSPISASVFPDFADAPLLSNCPPADSKFVSSSVDRGRDLIILEESDDPPELIRLSSLAQVPCDGISHTLPLQNFQSSFNLSHEVCSREQ